MADGINVLLTMNDISCIFTYDFAYQYLETYQLQYISNQSIDIAFAFCDTFRIA